MSDVFLAFICEHDNIDYKQVIPFKKTYNKFKHGFPKGINNKKNQNIPNLKMGNKKCLNYRFKSWMDAITRMTSKGIFYYTKSKKRRKKYNQLCYYLNFLIFRKLFLNYKAKVFKQTLKR